MPENKYFLIYTFAKIVFIIISNKQIIILFYLKLELFFN